MECKVCKWAGKNINMHLRHSTKCKELYSEDEIMGLKKEMKSVRNKRYKSKAVNKIATEKYNEAYREKPENKIAKQKYNRQYKEKPENKIEEQKYNKAYNEKLENQVSKQMYNQVYYGMEENKARKKEYNTKHNSIYYNTNFKRIMSKRRAKTCKLAQYFLKLFALELKDTELRFGHDWHECEKDGRAECKEYHTENCPCIYCFPSCPRHRHRVDRETHAVCINCSKICKKIKGINRIKCTECQTAWCFICNTKVPTQICYSYTHFYLSGYNDIVPGLCALHDTDNLTGFECEECDRVLKCMDNETDSFHDDGNDYLCELCEAKFDWPCEVAHHVLEHTYGKTLIIMKFTASVEYGIKSEEENVNNAQIIHKEISQLNNVIGVSYVSGIDEFLTPPWIFQVVLNYKDSIAEISFKEDWPKFIDSVDNITEEYGPLGKQLRGGISIWESSKALLLVESPKAQKFPVKLWLSDHCHAPHFKIISQSVDCQKCQQVIQDVPDILNNRIKKSTLTLYKCRRYKRYDCGCKAGQTLSGEPLEKYDQHGYYHSYWPKGHSGVRCDLKFYHACDFWKHYKDHNNGHEGRSLVRICVAAKGALHNKEDHPIMDNARKSLDSDPNVLLVDPQFDDNNCPIDYWGEGSCIDFIVKEDLNPEKYFNENIHKFVPKDYNCIIKCFPLGAYICKTMRCNVLLYEHFHKGQQTHEEYPYIEPEDIRKHMIENCLRKISSVRKKGLWRFEEVNRRYILIGGSLPQISMSAYISEGAENESDGFSDAKSTSSNEENSDGSMSENDPRSKDKSSMPSDAEDSESS